MENRMRIFCFACFIFFVSVLFFSCNFLQEELQTPREYRLQVPSVPEDWLAQSGLHLQTWLWLVDYVHTDSQSHNYSLEQKRHYGSSISISVKKRESAVALVYPIFAEFGEASDPRHLLWRPAGIDVLWQEHSGDLGHRELRTTLQTTLQTTWRAGFRSFVLHKLLEGGFDIRYFNVQKLQRYLDLRIGSDSAWDYDAEFLIAEIANLEVDWYDIRKRQTTQIFGLQGEGGFWQPLNMIDPAWRCSGACTPELALGRHYFLELEKLQLWHLEVLASGEVLAVLLSGLR